MNLFPMIQYIKLYIITIRSNEVAMPKHSRITMSNPKEITVINTAASKSLRNHISRRRVNEDPSLGNMTWHGPCTHGLYFLVVEWNDTTPRTMSYSRLKGTLCLFQPFSIFLNKLRKRWTCTSLSWGSNPIATFLTCLGSLCRLRGLPA